MTNNIVFLVMIVIAVALTSVILMQKRGSGVGAVFGGASESYRSKRGAEKMLYYVTILLGLLFALVPFTLLLIQ